MPKSNLIPNLISGVSQQADSLRFPSQAIEQINANSSIVEGLTKRAGSNHVAVASFSPLGSMFVHAINRDVNNQYLALFQDGQVKVFDTDGNQKSVTATSTALAYLSSSDPQNDFKAISIADYTFLLNKTKTAAMTATVSASAVNEGMVVVKQGDYGKRYVIKVNGTVAAEIVSATAESGHEKFISTDYIVKMLVTGTRDAADNAGSGKQTNIISYLTGTGGTLATGGYTVTYYNSVIKISRTSAFTLETSDGLSDTAMVAVKDSVDNFSRLPKIASNDFLIKIEGLPEENVDDYWVKFVKTDTTSGLGEGKWVESVAPATQTTIDKTTMPHALVKEVDGSFTFKSIDWTNRLVGDSTSNPDPSFIGHTINDIFFYRNRLGLLSEENVILSEASQFFNFWRTTVTQVLDAEPIDIAASHTKVSILYHAIPFYDQLLLLGQQAQFSLKSGDLLTTKTASIQQTTELQINTTCTPQMSGKNVYIGFDRGDYSGMLEHFVTDTTYQFDAFDVSIGIPSYLQGSPLQLSANENNKMVLMRTSGLTNGFYVYKYFMNGTEKLQSAWSTWKFEDGAVVQSINFIGNALFITVYRPSSGLCIERIDMQAGLKDPDSEYSILLDRRISDAQALGSSYDPVTDTTTYSLPYGVEDVSTFVAVTRYTSSYLNGGLELTPLSVTQGDASYGILSTVVLDSNTTAIPLWFGNNYRMSYTPNNPQIQTQASNTSGRQLVMTRRYQIRRGTLAFDNTLYFKVIITPLYREARTHHYNGYNADVGSTILNKRTLQDGQFAFPVLCKNDQMTVEIVNDSPFPCALTALEWLGEPTTFAS